MIEIALLVGVFVVLLVLGVPIAYSVGIAASATMLYALGPEVSATTLAQRMATALDSFALLAIPFFILAGNIMNQGGIARRLIDFAKELVGMLPGGLALVNIVACMLFGAISGSAVAAASAIGGFMGKRLEEEGYDKAFGAAVNITSATTGMVIPPSNILIIYSLASGGVSIGALFMAGYIPGMLMGFFLMVATVLMAWRAGHRGNGGIRWRKLVRAALRAMPSLLMLVLVIGGIVFGFFTATEASGIAVLYSFLLALAYGEMSRTAIRNILIQSAATTAIVTLLISTSMAMSWVLSFEDIPRLVADGMLGLSDNVIIILLLINILLLVVGIFMDMTPAVLIFTPIFLPVVTALGVDPVHFGIIMVVNLCIGLCTPPVGSVLFVGCGVANISIGRVIKPLIPLFVALVMALLVITYWPAASLWLPAILGY